MATINIYILIWWTDFLITRYFDKNFPREKWSGRGRVVGMKIKKYSA
jgi:hypothetical protein